MCNSELLNTTDKNGGMIDLKRSISITIVERQIAMETQIALILSRNLFYYKTRRKFVNVYYNNMSKIKLNLPSIFENMLPVIIISLV